MAVVAVLAGIVSVPDAARANQDKLDIEIYLSLEADVCGPSGYPPPAPCRILSASDFDNGRGRRFKPFRSGIVVPPGTIQWRSGELGTIRQYQELGPLDLSRRMSALVVFRWSDRRHTHMSLSRANRPERPFVVKLGDSRRTFYHLPLQYLDPTQQEEWVLKTNLATYRISFAQ
jgi:hypothetical protein